MSVRARDSSVGFKPRGYEAILSLQLGPDPGDDELLAFAASEGMVVLTLDRGFAKGVFTRGLASAAIVFLPDSRQEVQFALLEEILTKHGAALETGQWVIAAPGKIRVRKHDD
ncbi:MAG: hypothetical protein KBG84_01530 [Planctomycetes bacterium]|nr:hypothetical protein [Planctomycetota bacterium]